MQDRRVRCLYYLAAGHLLTDMNQAVLPALLPFFIADHNLTYSAAGGLVFGLNLLSSIVQPFFGILADKTMRPWIIASSVLLAGGGMAATGIFSTYPLQCVSVMISGIGIAAFHPEAARYANKVSGRNKATSMSIFSFGGNVGFALGPMVATGLVLSFGTQGIAFLFLPAMAVSILLLMEIRSLQNSATARVTKTASAGEQNQWKAFVLLCIVLFGRSVIFYGMTIFIPLYWNDVFMQSKAVANVALSLFLGVGAFSTLVGGRLSDHFGFQKIIRIGFLCLLPMLMAFVSTTNVVLATLLLIPIGVALYLSFSSMVVLGQMYLPGHIGLASGVTLGLVISVGGLAAPLLGLIADMRGLPFAMRVVAYVSIIPAVMAFTLPPWIKREEISES